MDEFYRVARASKSKKHRRGGDGHVEAVPQLHAQAEHAPQAGILFDKFHIMRHLGEALDKVRKSEYARLTGRDRKFIKGQKYALLSHRENLTTGARGLKILLAANKRLNTAYLLKESFGQLWDYQPEGWARRFFENWRDALKWQRLKPYEKFAEMIDRHWDGIAAYCEPGEQGRPRLRRGLQQQDPRHPTPRLRLTRRGVPPPQDPHVHAARALKTAQITHTTSGRPRFLKGRRRLLTRYLSESLSGSIRDGSIPEGHSGPRAANAGITSFGFFPDDSGSAGDIGIAAPLANTDQAGA